MLNRKQANSSGIFFAISVHYDLDLLREEVSVL